MEMDSQGDCVAIFVDFLMFHSVFHSIGVMFIPWFFAFGGPAGGVPTPPVHPAGHACRTTIAGLPRLPLCGFVAEDSRLKSGDWWR
jgi:hypothetical protein